MESWETERRKAVEFLDMKQPGRDRVAMQKCNTTLLLFKRRWMQRKERKRISRTLNVDAGRINTRAYLLRMMRVNHVTVLPLTAFTRAAERVSADVAFLPPLHFMAFPHHIGSSHH